MIPSEIILSFFALLSHDDLVSCSCVSILFHEISSNNKLFRPPTFLLSGYRLIKEGERAQQLFLPNPKGWGGRVVILLD